MGVPCALRLYDKHVDRGSVARFVIKIKYSMYIDTEL